MSNLPPLALSIVIVSWNVRDFLAKCLDTIITTKADLALEVIIVDSGSADGTVELIRANYALPFIKLLPQGQNVGFTKGNNIGLKAAQGRHLMLLNPDTEITGDALQQMVDYLDAHPDVGIVGPHTLNTDGTHQSSRRRFPRLITAFFESTWLQPYAPTSILDHFYAQDIDDHATADVDWVQGSALMMRREVYEKIGGLDEGYIMYSEELDWCKRSRDAGWRTVYLGSARIIHHGGKSTDQVGATKHIYFQQSKIRYFRKFHGKLSALLLRLFLIVSYLQQLLFEAFKGIIGKKRSLRGERVRIYWQVIRALSK